MAWPRMLPQLAWQLAALNTGNDDLQKACIDLMQGLPFQLQHRGVGRTGMQGSTHMPWPPARPALARYVPIPAFACRICTSHVT